MTCWLVLRLSTTSHFSSQQAAEELLAAVTHVLPKAHGACKQGVEQCEEEHQSNKKRTVLENDPKNKNEMLR